jgi:Flp pilus assembly protein TadD
MYPTHPLVLVVLTACSTSAGCERSQRTDAATEHRSSGSADASQRVTPPAMEGESVSREQADKLYAQARDAWQGGDCERALPLAEDANRKQFSRRHVSLIGVCACQLGLLERARWAYGQLQGGQRNILVQICKSKSVTLP